MNKNKNVIVTVVVAVILVLAIIFFFMFLIKNPVSLKLRDKKLSSNSDVSELLKVNQTALTQTPSGELAPINSTDNISGDINAKAKVIVYESLNDPYSAKLNETLKLLKYIYKDDVVIAYRPFFFKGDAAALNSAVAVNCAAQQNKFSEMREIILSELASSTASADFQSEAKSLNLNADKFSTCLASTKNISAVKDAVDNVYNSLVFGSPTTFVNGELVVGARYIEDSLDSSGNKLEGLKNIVARHLQ